MNTHDIIIVFVFAIVLLLLFLSSYSDVGA
jgi:hypothetical protein